MVSLESRSHKTLFRVTLAGRHNTLYCYARGNKASDCYPVSYRVMIFHLLPLGYMNRSKRSFFALHMGHTSGGCSLAQR